MKEQNENSFDIKLLVIIGIAFTFCSLLFSLSLFIGKKYIDLEDKYIQEIEFKIQCKRKIYELSKDRKEVKRILRDDTCNLSKYY